MTGNGDHAAAPGQSGGDSRPGREAVTAYARVAAWPQLLDRLDLVRRQWDLAIIASLRDGGVRPAALMRTINAQARRRRLTWKVLAERLDWLEGEGYLTRREVGLGETWYWLRPRSCQMLAALDALAAWYDEHESRACGA
jgi:DNA-binding HxlR family transcriptional regulator